MKSKFVYNKERGTLYSDNLYVIVKLLVYKDSTNILVLRDEPVLYDIDHVRAAIERLAAREKDSTFSYITATTNIRETARFNNAIWQSVAEEGDNWLEGMHD